MENNKMENVSRLINEISANTFEVGSWLWVDVLHINNPHSFYVRPRTYNKYLPLLQARGNRPDTSKIHIGDIFVFSSNILKSFVRGKIIGCEKLGANVMYKMFVVDIGCIEERVFYNRIWTTVYRHHVPPLATHCQLSDCAPIDGTWNHEATAAMRSYVEGERAKMIIRNKTVDNIIVDLFNSRPDDVATLLALTGYTTFGIADNGARQYGSSLTVSQCYIQRQLQVGEVIHVRMQAGTLLDQFYVTPIEDYQLYLNDRNNYTSQARSLNEMYMKDLKLNTPIGVLYHKTNKFERALVKEFLPDNRAKVQLVDIGIIIEETVMRMKIVPDWYLRIPTRALRCTLHSSQAFTNNMSSMVYPGAECLLTIKGLGNEDTMRPNVVLISPLKSGSNS